MRSFALLALVVLLAAAPDSVHAGDWPQILGPQRNGTAQAENLATWPAAGPETLWQMDVGQGFSGVAVVGQRAVVFHRLGGELVAQCLNAASGKPLWRATFPTRYTSTISSDDGPRCVPVIHDNHVYLLGPGGELACVALDTGKQLWFRNLLEEFDAAEGYFGAGSSPLVEGDKLLVNVGGSRGAGIVALGLNKGETLWKATNEGASYSSPVATTLDGVRHVVFVTRLSALSLDPRDGAVRFRFPFGARGPTVNAANPLVLGDHLFLSASYGVGARWVRFGKDAGETEWDSDEVMSSQYTTCVHKAGVLYGIDGRQDVGMARLRAFDPRTRKVFWTEEGFGTGSLILAGDKLLIMKTEGELVLAEATSAAYRPLAKARIFHTAAQALPALAAGRLYVRDTKTLKCLRVGADTTSGDSAPAVER